MVTILFAVGGKKFVLVLRDHEIGWEGHTLTLLSITAILANPRFS